MFPLKNTEAYIHANGYRSTLGKELAARDAEIADLNSQIQALTNEVRGNWATGGVNLFDPSAYSSYKQSDGSYRLTGSQANAIRVNVPKSLVGVECTASIYLDLSKETAPTQVYICATVSGTTSYGNRIGANSEGVTKITFTPQSVSDTIGLTFGSEGSNYFTMTDLQLEKGSEVTEYQPYAKTNVELTQEIDRKVENSASSLSFSMNESEMYIAFTRGGLNNSYSYVWLVVSNTGGALGAIPIREGTAQTVSLTISGNVATVACSDTTLMMGYTKI